MKIFLVQHGQTVPEEIDPEKPLSPDGREEIEKIARFLAQRSFPLSFILHSQKLRTKQTAEIMGEALNPKATIKEFRDLGPHDALGPILKRIEGEDRDFMIVGHLPFLNRLVGELLVSDEKAELIHFEKGKTVCLMQSNGNWVIDWVLGVHQL